MKLLDWLLKRKKPRKIILSGIGPLGKKAKVIVDGHDITRFVTNVNLAYGVDIKVPKITLELVSGHVEITDEIEAIVEPIVKCICKYGEGKDPYCPKCSKDLVYSNLAKGKKYDEQPNTPTRK